MLFKMLVHVEILLLLNALPWNICIKRARDSGIVNDGLGEPLDYGNLPMSGMEVTEFKYVANHTF